jgi:hypothetical protein
MVRLGLTEAEVRKGVSRCRDGTPRAGFCLAAG